MVQILLDFHYMYVPLTVLSVCVDQLSSLLLICCCFVGTDVLGLHCEEDSARDLVNCHTGIILISFCIVINRLPGKQNRTCKYTVLLE